MIRDGQGADRGRRRVAAGACPTWTTPRSACCWLPHTSARRGRLTGWRTSGPYTMNEIVDTVENLLETEFDRQVAHDRMRLPSVASEVALVVDATIQRTGLYQQKIHVLSEMNKTIACSVDKARAELGLPAERRAPRGHAPLDPLVPRARPGDLKVATAVRLRKTHRRPRPRGDAPAPVGEERLRPGRARLRRRDASTPDKVGDPSLLVFAAFCLASGAAYLVNDVVDAEADRHARAHGLAADRPRRPRPAHRPAGPPSLASSSRSACVAVDHLADGGHARGLPGAPGRLFATVLKHVLLRGRHGDRRRLRAARLRGPDLRSTSPSRSGCSSARGSIALFLGARQAPRRGGGAGRRGRPPATRARGATRST